MSSFGSQMRKRLDELRRAGENVPKIMAEVAEGATIEAVRVAAEKTPPNDGTLAGTNMRSGQMAQHWATDSVTTPVVTGGSVRTELNNNMQYASYVNDGHRVEVAAQHYIRPHRPVGCSHVNHPVDVENVSSFACNEREQVSDVSADMQFDKGSFFMDELE